METTYNSNTKLAAARRKVQRIKGFYRHVLVYILVNIFIVVTVGYEDGFNEAGIYLPALFWGFGLACHGFSVFAEDWLFGKDWEARKIQEIMNQ